MTDSIIASVLAVIGALFIALNIIGFCMMWITRKNGKGRE